MTWLLALSLSLLILLLPQITLASIYRIESINNYLVKSNHPHSMQNGYNKIYDNSYNKQLFSQRELRSLNSFIIRQALDISDSPTQAPTVSPTLAQSKDGKMSTEIFAVAFGILAIIFLALVLSFFLCGRYFYHQCQRTNSSQSTKVYPTYIMGGTEIAMLAGSMSPRLDYSEYLRQQMALKSSFIATEEYHSQKKEKEKLDKVKQEERQKQIENIINVKLNVSQSRTSFSMHSNAAASKYRISSELLDIENSPNSSS